MPSQRRFEGTDVETLLDRVHRELGPDAQIVEANRVRKGGVGGFFSRETFEIVAEPPAPESTATGSAGSGPIRMPHADRFDDDMLAGGDDGPTLSTETASFAEILDRLARETVEDDDTDPDDTPPAIAARPAELRRTRASDARDVEAGEPAAMAARDGARTVRPHVWPRFDDALDDEDDDTAFAPSAGPAAPPAAPAAPAAPARVLAPTAPLATPSRRMTLTAAERSPLVGLGLPATLVPVDTTGRDFQVELARRLQALPTAPEVPTAAGSVVAVVGDRDESVRVAGELALELEIDPENVVVASRTNAGELPPWLHVPDAHAAVERRRSWWRRTRVTVVAVESTDGVEGSTWARHVVDALEPTLTWGVVDATRKAEDVAAWAERLGAVDAIALQNVRATVSPASVLHTGIPVARLDGRRATPERWAQLLAERLAA